MKIVVLLLLGFQALAQTTTVSGTITDPAGDLLTGSCAIQAMGPFSAAIGWRVTGAPMVVRFSAGAFTAALAPTDSASPAGQYYKVICAVPQQTVSGRMVGPYSWGPRYWLVPTDAATLDIGTVEISAPPPSPSWMINWSQLAQNGAQNGQIPIWNGSSWQPGFTSTTAGTTASFTGTLSGDVTGTQQATVVQRIGGQVPAPSATIDTTNAANITTGTLAAERLPPAGGDLSGPLNNATVTKLQGNQVATTAPADGQMMRWSAAAQQWQPVVVRYTVAFTNATAVSVLGNNHQLATADLTVTCYDTATPPNLLEPDGWTIDSSTFNVTITFAVPQSGRCVLR